MADVVFIVLMALVVGLFWEHQWKCYDLRQLLIRECGDHELRLENQRGYPTMFCNRCPFQRPAIDEEIKRDGESD